MPGRHRKPNALKNIQGTQRKDRKREEPKFPPVHSAEPPNWMTNLDAVAEWKRLVAILTPVYVLTTADLTMLAQACALYGDIVKGYREAVPVRPTAAELAQLRYLYTEFGLTPASRSKVTPAADKDAANPFVGLAS